MKRLPTTETTTCCRCHKVKPLSEFTIIRDIYIYSKCKACCAELRRIAVANNREFYARYQREYNEKHREKVRDYNQKYYIKRAETQREHSRNWKKCNPEKNRAEKLLNAAVVRGIITRKPCIICGSNKSVAHHPDYSKPYDVMWLCHVHHQRLHHQEVIPFEVKSEQLTCV